MVSKQATLWLEENCHQSPGKYRDDTWLGRDGMRTEEAPGQWPVSYHGTNMKGTQLILKEGIDGFHSDVI